MWRTNKQEWERRKSYLLRNLFLDISELSPINESREPSTALDEDLNEDKRPLPDLIIEIETKKSYDEPKEFYDNLEKEMRRLYRRDFLNRVDDSSSLGNSEVADEDYFQKGSNEKETTFVEKSFEIANLHDTIPLQIIRGESYNVDDEEEYQSSVEYEERYSCKQVITKAVVHRIDDEEEVEVSPGKTVAKERDKSERPEIIEARVHEIDVEEEEEERVHESDIAQEEEERLYESDIAQELLFTERVQESDIAVEEEAGANENIAVVAVDRVNLSDIAEEYEESVHDSDIDEEEQNSVDLNDIAEEDEESINECDVVAEEEQKRVRLSDIPEEDEESVHKSYIDAEEQRRVHLSDIDEEEVESIHESGIPEEDEESVHENDKAEDEEEEPMDLAKSLAASQERLHSNTIDNMEVSPELMRRRQTSASQDSITFHEMSFCEYSDNVISGNVAMDVESIMLSEQSRSSEPESSTSLDINFTATSTPKLSNNDGYKTKLNERSRQRFTPYLLSSGINTTSRHVQTSFSSDEPELTDIWKNIFVGTPIVNNICHCGRHVCE